MNQPAPQPTDRPAGTDPSPGTDAPTRGDATREALIRAGIEMFGRDGFDSASTRAISEAAGVNQALIGYHFGGKPGLYLAALKFIADSVAARIGPLVATIEAELDVEIDADSGGAAPGRAIALLHGFTDAFAAMLTSEDSKSWARLILREQQDPSEGFELLYEGVMRRVLDMTTRLVARARRLDAADDRCKLTALTIVGQMLIFRAGREAVLRRMEWQCVSETGLKAIQAEIRRNVTAILTSEHPQ
ncbi:MAG: CerR family C-terminal domain-containing protein [Gammaproteobacteria bacterium]|jgi:AcrR family transcriptional regulator